MSKIVFLFILFLTIGLVYLQQNLAKNKALYTTNAVMTSTIDQNIPLMSLLDSDQKREVTKIINVSADGDQFSPNSFEIPHLKSIILRINAIDKDYTFILRDFNIQTSIPQGKTVDIKVSGLGVGSFPFECSSTCQGTVHVIELADEADSNI